MNLYLISQKLNEGYYYFDSALVAAENEEAAKLIHPDGNSCAIDDWSREYDSSWPKSTDQVDAKLIGVATEGTETGAILSSFNAD